MLAGRADFNLRGIIDKQSIDYWVGRLKTAILIVDGIFSNYRTPSRENYSRLPRCTGCRVFSAL